MAVDDRLRQPGGAARIDDPERVIERQPGRRERRVVGDQRVEVVRRTRRTGERADVGVGVEVAQQHRVAHARQLLDQAAQHRQAVGVDTAVDVAVDADHDLGLDLAEAVEDRQRPHVGRAHRPDRAQAGAGEEGDRGLRQVGQDGADPVAGNHAHARERRRERRHLAAQLGPGDLERLAVRLHRLVAKDDRRMAGGVAALGMAEHVLRVVDLRAAEPLGARHRLGDQHGVVRRRRLDREEVEDRLPEAAQVVARPAPEAFVPGRRGRVEIEAALLAQPARVSQDLRLGRAHGRSSRRAATGCVARCASASCPLPAALRLVDVDPVPPALPEQRRAGSRPARGASCR